MLPGPVTMVAEGQDSVPCANIATAWAPPAAYTSSMPSSAQAARIVGCGRPPNSFCGGDASAMEGTAGLLCRDGVHDHGRRVHRPAAGGVQPHAVDRHPLLGDRATGHDLGGVRRAALFAVDETGAADGLLQGRAHGGVELLQGVGEGLGRNTHGLQPYSVELLRVVDQRRVAPMMHGLADRSHLLQGGRDVEVGSGQQVAQGGALGEGVAAQIDSSDREMLQHGDNSLRRRRGAGRPYQWLIQATFGSAEDPRHQ